MLHRYAYSKGINKKCGLYIMASVVIPIFGIAITLALIEGYLRSAIVMVITIVGWSVGVLCIARQSLTQRKKTKTHTDAKVSARQKSLFIVLERTFWLLVLIIGAAGLFKAPGSSKSLYYVVEGLGFVVMGGGHFFFVSILPDEWFTDRKPV